MACRLHPYPVIHPFIGDTKLVVEKGMTGATGNIYTGLDEFADMAFLLHFLQPADLFIDIGSNIGSYTILASGYVGANTIAFEPAPDTFEKLLRNIAVNGLGEKVRALNIALGGNDGEVAFTIGLDTVNHIVASSTKAASHKVKMRKLDDVLVGEKPALLKIDVEGFETEVLNGAGQTLQTESLKAIIIELNGSGRRYGHDESLIHELLLQQQFRPFRYHPFRRQIEPLQRYGSLNTIYIRDQKFVERIIRESPKVSVFNQSF